MVELKPFTRDDFGRLMEWVNISPAFLMQWAGPLFTFPLDKVQLERYIQPSEGVRPNRHIFKVVGPNDELIMGHVELDNVDFQNRSATLCRVLVAKEFRGQGLCSRIVRRILQFGFDGLELRRIDLRVFGFVEPAIRCYESTGFVKEGYLRDVRRFGEDYWGVHVMSILGDEWKKNQNTPATS